jgi:hypothetical protein
MTDRALSEKIGCEPTAITTRRKLLNIPKYALRVDWAQWDSIIGVEPNFIVAKKIGCPLNLVKKRRVQKMSSNP